MKKLVKLFALFAISATTAASISLSLTSKTQRTNAYDNGLYDDCEEAYNNRDKDALYAALKTAANTGYSSGSYDGLWSWYTTVDVENSKIVDMYSNTSSFTPGDSKCGTYKVEGDCYNREHTIPQSWWGSGTSAQGCDIFIVYPTDGKINGVRSNYPYGEVGTVEKASDNNYSLLGTSKLSGYSGTVFEPNDEWKGDLARVYFYTRVKWYGVAMTDAEGDSCFSGSQSTNYGLSDYGVSLFMSWHKKDPVSTWETGRNDRAQSCQGNRNPFIDHPEYADLLWGSEEAPTSISLSGTTTINAGETTTITVTPTPSTASNSVTWSSDNTSVATVTNGIITGVSAGTATITATSTLDTSVSATITITVNATKTVTSLTYEGTPTKTTYTTSESFDPTGITVTAHYSDSTTAVVTDSVSWDALQVGTTATGSFGGKSITITGLTITEPTPVTSHTIVATDLPNSYPTTETTYTSATGLKFNSYYCGHFSSSGKLQFKKSSGAYIANTTAQSSLKSLTINNPTNGTFSVYGSNTYGEETTAITGSNNVYDLTGYTYFKVKNASSSTLYCTSIVLAYEETQPTVSVSPTSMSLIIGGQKTITATTTGSATLSWSSSNTNVATVNDGVVTAIGLGNATITATYGTATATCSVTVSEESIVLDKTELNLVAGKADKINATATGDVTWEITSNLVATVDSDGNVQALSSGTATITATSGSKSATCLVTVTAASATHSGTADDPFTVSEAYQHCQDGDLTSTTTYYTKGKVESISTTWSGSYMTLNLANPSDSTKSLYIYKMTNSSVDPQVTVDNTIVVSALGSKYTTYKTTTIEINAPAFVSKTVGTAAQYSKDFMKSITCDTTGGSSPTYVNLWATLKNMYSYLSSDEKNKLINATYTINGAGNSTFVTPTNDTDEIIAVAMYRYDFLVNKYGNESFIEGRATSNNPVIKIDENIVPIVVIFSITLIVAACGIIYIKKSKHN